MKWDSKLFGRRRKAEERPASVVELEAILEMLIIQDKMAEMAIRILQITEWGELSANERERKEEEFRRVSEAKNALFKRPKEEAIQHAREQLGLNAPRRVHSYGDVEEVKWLKEFAESKKRMEKQLHRQTRESLRCVRKLDRVVDRRRAADVESNDGSAEKSVGDV